MRFEIRFDPAAEADLREIYDYVSGKASPEIARRYVDRILAFITQLETFPRRGNSLEEMRPGLRTMGFERRASIAFVVEAERVVVLRVLYAGRRMEDRRS